MTNIAPAVHLLWGNTTSLCPTFGLQSQIATLVPKDSALGFVQAWIKSARQKTFIPAEKTMMSTQPSTSLPEEHTDDQPESERPLTVTSQEVLQGRRELWIEHEGQIYRLRVTSRGKLYLTK